MALIWVSDKRMVNTDLFFNVEIEDNVVRLWHTNYWNKRYDQTEWKGYLELTGDEREAFLAWAKKKAGDWSMPKRIEADSDSDDEG